MDDLEEEITNIYVDSNTYALLNNYEESGVRNKVLLFSDVSNGSRSPWPMEEEEYMCFEIYAEKCTERHFLGQKCENENDAYCSTPSFSISEDDSTDDSELSFNLNNVKEVQFGYLINEQIFLTCNQWNTVMQIGDIFQCGLCDKIIISAEECTEHLETDNHQYKIGFYKPLEKYGLSITRKIDDKYHCAVCNCMYTQLEWNEIGHYDSDSHKDALKCAADKASRLFNLKGNDGNNNLRRTDELLCKIAIEQAEGNSKSKQFSYANVAKNKQSKEEHSNQTSYAEIAKKPKSDDLPKNIMVQVLGNAVMLDFDAWHMIILNKNKYYCMACKNDGPSRYRGEHIQSTGHEEKLSRCVLLTKYSHHLIRYVDCNFCHCTYCNDLEYTNTVNLHLEKVKHERLLRKCTRIANIDNTDESNKSIQDIIQKNIDKFINEPVINSSNGPKSNEAKFTNIIFMNQPLPPPNMPPPPPNSWLPPPSMYGPLTQLNGPLSPLIRPLPQLNGPLSPLNRQLPQLNGPSQPLNRPLPQLNGPLSPLNRPLPQLNGPLSPLNRPLLQLNGPLSPLNRPLPQLNGPLPRLNGPPQVMQSFITLNLFGWTTYVNFLAWNYIQMYSNGVYHCAICNMDVVDPTNYHVNDKFHTDRVAKVSLIPQFEYHLIRPINSQLVHCAICNLAIPNDIQAICSHSKSQQHSYLLKKVHQAPPEVLKEVNIPSEKPLTPDPEDGGADEYDKKYIYVKINNNVLRTSYEAWNTIVVIDQSHKYCFVCGLILNVDVVECHIKTEEHVKNLNETMVLEKYGSNVIRKISNIFHCCICNFLAASNPLQEHLHWHDCLAKLEERTVSSKKVRKLKNIIEPPMQSYFEEDFEEHQEVTNDEHCHLKIIGHYEIKKSDVTDYDENDRNLDSPESDDETFTKLHKVVVINGKFHKVKWMNWHGVTQAKNDYKCIPCQFTCDDDPSEHLTSGAHINKINRTIFVQKYRDDLIRQVNNQVLNCIVCNIELPKNSKIGEHIGGFKHRTNYNILLDDSSKPDIQIDIHIFRYIY